MGRGRSGKQPGAGKKSKPAPPREVRVETASEFGRTVRFIRTDTGDILYEQKKPLDLLPWRDRIVANMTKAGFSHDEIVDVLKQARWEYFNKKFYRDPKQIARRAVEGWYS